ncbi:MAG: DUF427 domain-containing protein [Nitrososphaeraceae archaeon]
MKAIWNDAVVAESDKTVEVEGNQYFPPTSINKKYFIKSETQTICGWKGSASYYSLVVNGKTNPDCAWYYPNPKPNAKHLLNYVAFWNGVKIEND